MIKKGLRRPKEPEVSRQEFIDAAYELFVQKGYHDTSVDDVIKRSGRSKGGFYHHFDSKAELFVAMFEGIFQKAVEPFDGAFLEDLSIEEALSRGFERQQEQFGDIKVVKAGLELFFVALRDPEAKRIVRRINDVGITFFTTVLRKLTKEKRIRPLGRNLGPTAEMIYHGMRGIALMEVVLNDGKDLYPKMSRYLRYELENLKPRSKE
jgi:AcrR family transcriptional regulator